MTKKEILKTLVDGGVIAVIRATDVETAVAMAKACAKGGILGLEITFTVPNADAVIEKLCGDKTMKAIVGAGTVLDAKTCRIAIRKGARFIVSPAFDSTVATLCRKANIPYIPGCLTPTEIVRAMRAKADIIKIFPGSVGGPSYFTALHGPFPEAKFLPSGGVNLENVKEWIRHGAVAVSAGSSLTAPAKIGDYDTIVKNAGAFVDEVKAAREELRIL